MPAAYGFAFLTTIRLAAQQNIIMKRGIDQKICWIKAIKYKHFLQKKRADFAARTFETIPDIIRLFFLLRFFHSLGWCSSRLIQVSHPDIAEI